MIAFSSSLWRCLLGYASRLASRFALRVFPRLVLGVTLLFCCACVSLPTQEVAPQCMLDWKAILGAEVVPPVAMSYDIQVQVRGARSVFFTGVMLVAAPDKIRMDIFTPLGTLASTVVVARGEFQVLVVAANATYGGRVSDQRMGMLLLLPLSPAEIVGIVSGSLGTWQRGMRLAGCANNSSGRGFSLWREGEKRQVWLDDGGRPVRYVGGISSEPFNLLVEYRGDFPWLLTGQYRGNEITLELTNAQSATNISPEVFEFSKDVARKQAERPVEETW